MKNRHRGRNTQFSSSLVVFYSGASKMPIFFKENMCEVFGSLDFWVFNLALAEGEALAEGNQTMFRGPNIAGRFLFCNFTVLIFGILGMFFVEFDVRFEVAHQELVYNALTKFRLFDPPKMWSN